MPSPGQNFKKTLHSWADKAGDKLEALARQATLATAEIVVLNTPVDTGFLRGNWQAAIDKPSVAPGTIGGPGEVGARVSITIKEFKTGTRFYFTNNTAYARAQEYGTTTMEGRFYVQSGVKRWRQTVKEAALALGITK